MAFVCVQGAANNVGAGATQLVKAFNNPVTPGNFLVAYCGTTAPGRTWTASDDVNGAWTTDRAGAICTFLNTAAGTPTVTVTMTGAAGEMDMIIEEWSGVATTNALDQTQGQANASGTSGSTGNTGVLAVQNELALACCHLSSTSGNAFAVSSAGWTPGPASPYPALNNAYFACASFQPGASTAAVGATFTWQNARTSLAAVCTYRPAASPGGGGMNSQAMLIGVGR